ncbi:MAG: site-2 protease family protein [bacterium]|nr:site-2 protease family protein [bacterium]
MESAITFIFYLAILIFSVVIHEVSHGIAAYALGDSTAKYAGRLTLNPIPHIDIFGSIILPLVLAIPAVFGAPTIIFGWAKPVPYNPHNLKNQQWGPALVGAAGPGANIILASIFGLAIRLLPGLGFLPAGFVANFVSTLAIIVLLNLSLAIFNLVPIPPLDGSKVLFSLLPHYLFYIRDFLERNGLFILLIFIFFFSRLLFPVVLFFFQLFTGQSISV